MRLAILNQFYIPDLSPTAHVAGSLAEHRAAKGDEVTVIAGRAGYVSGSAPPVKSWAGDNPRLREIPSLGHSKKNLLVRMFNFAAFHLLAAVRLATLPRQTVVIAMTTPPLIVFAAVIHRLLHRNTRVILWIQDCYPEIAESSGVIRELGLASRAARAVNRFLFRRCERIVVLDSAMENVLHRNYPEEAASRPIDLIPNFERLERFPAEPDPACLPELPDSLAAVRDGDKFVVLYLGNAGFGHRFETLIEIATALIEQPFLFLFIGGGSKWSWLKQQRKEHHLENIQLHGYIPKELTPAVMAAADCALVTMRDEALGLICPSKIHSNLAMKLPLLYFGPEQSNVDEAISSFDCGASLRHGDSAGAQQFLERLQGDPAELARYRGNARQAFEQAYCDRSSLAAFDRILDAG